MQDRHRRALQAALRTLTPREREVMNYLLLGRANKVIAMELGMSMRTVETHRSRIFLKMGVRNAIELVRRCYAPDLWAQGLPLRSLPEIMGEKIATDGPESACNRGPLA